MVLIPSVYFFTLEFLELVQMAKESNSIIKGLLEYLLDIRNYVDLMPPVIIFVSEIIAAYDRYHHYNSIKQCIENDSKTDECENFKDYEILIRYLYSLSTFLMWIKFIYFLRTFETTGFYVRMIIQVFHDVRHFMIIFLTVVICFSHTFFIFL